MHPATLLRSIVLLLAASCAACLRLGQPMMMGGKIVSHGPFAPAVRGLKNIMGEQELNELRAKIIGEHSKVIKQFVDTSDTPTGQIALKVLFEAADKDGNGTLDKEEVAAALRALCLLYTSDAADEEHDVRREEEQQQRAQLLARALGEEGVDPRGGERALDRPRLLEQHGRRERGREREVDDAVRAVVVPRDLAG